MPVLDEKLIMVWECEGGAAGEQWGAARPHSPAFDDPAGAASAAVRADAARVRRVRRAFARRPGGRGRYRRARGR
jgi:hypothetical protein